MYSSVGKAMWTNNENGENQRKRMCVRELKNIQTDGCKQEAIQNDLHQWNKQIENHRLIVIFIEQFPRKMPKQNRKRRENQIRTVCNVLWQICFPKISSIFFGCLHRSWTFFMRTPFWIKCEMSVCVWVRIGFSLMSTYFINKISVCIFVWNSTKGRIFFIGKQKQAFVRCYAFVLNRAFDLSSKHWIWL